MICELTGMEIANASMYDGSTGAAEAVMMAVRVTGRRRSWSRRTVHPEYREVLATYAQHQGIRSRCSTMATTAGVDLEDARSRDHAGNSMRAGPVARTSSASSKTSRPSPRSRTSRARC